MAKNKTKDVPASGTSSTPDEYTQSLQKFLGGLEIIHNSTNKEDRLIFGPDELRCRTNPLAKLLRMVFNASNMTTRGFKSRFQEYATRSRYSTGKTTSTCANSIRSMQNPNLTYRLFEDLLTYSGMVIVDATITVTDTKTGQTITVSTKDARTVADQEDNAAKNKEPPEDE